MYSILEEYSNSLECLDEPLVVAVQLDAIRAESRRTRGERGELGRDDRGEGVGLVEEARVSLQHFRRRLGERLKWMIMYTSDPYVTVSHSPLITTVLDISYLMHHLVRRIVDGRLRQSRNGDLAHVFDHPTPMSTRNGQRHPLAHQLSVHFFRLHLN